MLIARILRNLLSSAAAVLLAACAATGLEPVEPVNTSGAEMVQSSVPDIYRMHAGDEITITAVNRPELSLSTRIDPQGYIQYPYIGQVLLRDLTADEVVQLLTRKLQEGEYFRRVNLTVSFVGSKEQFVYVLGEVKKPGPIPINGSIPLLSALGIAGGQTYDAEMSTVMWIRGRENPPGAVKMNLGALGDPKSENPSIPNFRLVAGDIVYIPDSTLAASQRFFNRMFDIIRPFVALETGIILMNDVEDTIHGDYHKNRSNNSNTIIINPLSK